MSQTISPAGSFLELGNSLFPAVGRRNRKDILCRFAESNFQSAYGISVVADKHEMHKRILRFLWYMFPGAPVCYGLLPCCPAVAGGIQYTSISGAFQ